MSTSYEVQEFTITEHVSRVPVVWADPGRFGDIDVFTREVVATAARDKDLPALIFLQGGPGGESPRPPHNTWIKWATKHFRVFLMDQRGTGRSTPVNGRVISDLSEQLSVAGAADYLSFFRADSIADDVAYLAGQLTPTGKWVTLGQSFGGFITLALLSRHPEVVTASLTTGGIPAIDRDTDTLYEDLIPLQTARNEEFRTLYPADQNLLNTLATIADAGGLVTTGGEQITARRLQMLGWSFGMSDGVENLHWLLDTALDSYGNVQQRFVESVAHATDYTSNPLYITLQEGCYHQGKRSGWGAYTTLQRHPEYASNARPLQTFAEFAQPWMFDEIPSLRPFKTVAEELAGERDWSQLWDVEQLERNEVPLAAAQYVHDPYVGLAGAKRTLAHVGNSHLWATDEYLHNGLRLAGDKILAHLCAEIGLVTE